MDGLASNRGAALLALAVVGMGACSPAVDPSPTPAGEFLAMSGGVPETGGTTGSGGLVLTGGTASGGEAPQTGGTTAGAILVETDVPCEVVQLLSDHCWRCHGQEPDWGGPMPLVTGADFEAMGKLTTSTDVATLVENRLRSDAKPMPPITEPEMLEADKSVLEAWLSGGRIPSEQGTCQVKPRDVAPPMPATGGSDSPTGTVVPSWPGGIKPEETCYQFLKHGGQTPGDTSPHLTPVGEKYINWYYKVPWTEDVVATRWRTIYDRTEVLHHWLLYQSVQSATRDGQWEEQIGTHPGAKLLGVWAVGGGDEMFPNGVGLKMPPPGSLLEIEWHLYNTTGAPVPDNSGIEVCVVPESKADPRFVAGVTWLGTEAVSVAPSQETKLGGICTPSFKNGGPIHIIKWMPHMHLLGRHMDTWVYRKDGTEEHVFDKPFLFDTQIMYDQSPALVIEEGDRIHAQCTFQNDTALPVLFGQSTTSEMCYQFAFAYPYGSLDGAVPATLTGSDNTCLGIDAPHP